MKHSEALKMVEAAVDGIGAYVYSIDGVQFAGELKENELPNIPQGKYTFVTVRVAIPTNG